MIKTILFRIWNLFTGICLLFGLPAEAASAKAGAWNLVLFAISFGRRTL